MVVSHHVWISPSYTHSNLKESLSSPVNFQGTGLASVYVAWPPEEEIGIKPQYLYVT